MAPADRQAFLDAVAAARPEARRLIGLVDGLVDVRIGPTGTPGAIGLTEDGEPGYRVTIDLGLVLARYGPRGVERTVLHELGHVVDHALLTDDVTAALDAGIPAGLGCEEGMLGGVREPRGALRRELRQVGAGRHRGQPRHRLQGPAARRPLDVWGAPLARLAASA